MPYSKSGKKITGQEKGMEVEIFMSRDRVKKANSYVMSCTESQKKFLLKTQEISKRQEGDQ